ncbi:MAG: hypothetical protein IJ405_00740 [Lachnospiraceae bacterium]|nr:hypothetical protein [Lachnospiraceae bacterium]
MYKKTLIIWIMSFVLLATALGGCSKSDKNIDLDFSNVLNEYDKNDEDFYYLTMYICVYYNFITDKYNESNKVKLSEIEDVDIDILEDLYGDIIEYLGEMPPLEEQEAYEKYLKKLELIEQIERTQTILDERERLLSEDTTKSEEWYDKLKQSIEVAYKFYSAYDVDNE